MKITTTQLRKIIKEELKESFSRKLPGKAVTLDFLEGQLKTWRPEALERLISVLETERFDLTEEILKIASDELATYVYDSQD